MDRMIRTRWVEGLRSGLFLQGREALRSGDLFCCLGVLCEIVKDDISLIVHPDPVADGVVMYGVGKETGLLPHEVAEYAGVSDEVQDQLILMNDDEQLGFDEISDWVERNL
jgi:hypothetical protein